MADEPLTAEQLLARSIRFHRDRLRLTALQLSERIAEIGGSVSRQAISKIELAERDVRIDELMLIARALKMSPLLLLFPIGTETDRIPGEVSLAGQTMPMWEAVQWFTGEAYPPEDVDVHWGVPLYLFRAHHKLRMERMEFQVDQMFGPKDEEAQARAQAEMDARWSKLMDVRAEMRRHGLTPPPAVEDLEGIDKRRRGYMSPTEIEARVAAGERMRVAGGKVLRPGQAARMGAQAPGRSFMVEFDPGNEDS